MRKYLVCLLLTMSLIPTTCFSWGNNQGGGNNWNNNPWNPLYQQWQPIIQQFDLNTYEQRRQQAICRWEIRIVMIPTSFYAPEYIAGKVVYKLVTHYVQKEITQQVCN